MDRQRYKRGALFIVLIVAAAVLPVRAASAAPPIPGLAVISAGADHTCAVTTTNQVKCWGKNDHGQLGTGNLVWRDEPAATSTLTGYESVATGFSFSCGIQTANGGSVFCWGNNDRGQVGNGASGIGEDVKSPTATRTIGTVALQNVASISAGSEHACAVLDSGGVRCWGRNNEGQLGDQTTLTRRFAQDVFGLTSGVAHVAASGQHTCALTIGGAVKCWGDNSTGGLGDGSLNSSTVPVDVSGLNSGVASIALGGTHSCALKTTGEVRCWGSNGAGQLGDNTTTNRTTPVIPVGLGSGVAAIAAGGGETCAIKTNATLVCFGSNTSGQVGGGTTLSPIVLPFTVPGGTNVAAVTIGRAHACLRLNAGNSKCWGENGSGQLGDNSTIDLWGPFVPDPPESVHATRGDRTATVVWGTPIDNGGSELVRYDVTSTPPTVPIEVAPGDPLTATFDNLTNGTSYTFRVTAVNLQGASRVALSNAVTPATNPGVPTGLSATTASGKVTVSWKAAPTNGSAIKTYRVTSTPGNRSATVSGTARKGTISGLTNGSTYTFRVTATNGVGTGPASAPLTKKLPKPKVGYLMLGANGTVYPFGKAPRLGSAVYTSWASGVRAAAITVRASGTGYWVVDTQGGVRAFGTAKFLGQRPRLNPGEVISTLAATPTGKGYWLFSNRGRAVAYGDARHFGDKNGQPLNGPIIASAATPTGRGYFMVASDGGVFTFGDAKFRGSTGNMRLNKPVVGLSATPSNRGYWLVASDGGVFAFGDAAFRGSMGGTPLSKPVNGLVPFGKGYLMVASDGGVFNFSDKPFLGSLGANPPAAPIIGIAAFVA